MLAGLSWKKSNADGLAGSLPFVCRFEGATALPKAWKMARQQRIALSINREAVTPSINVTNSRYSQAERREGLFDQR
jgi:hypothetical protein